MKNVLVEDFKRIADSNLSLEKFKNSTFLITGATGLVGSLLVKFLLFANQEYGLGTEVLAVIRNPQKADKIFEEQKTDALHYIVADLEKDSIQYEGTCDYIIHAAAVTASKIMVSDPIGTIRTAIDGTEKILRFAAEKKVNAVVYISSMEIYGQPKTDGKTAEKDLGYVDIGTVRSCYPEGKRMCECLCTAYASQYGIRVMSARLAQTFGAGVLPTENRVFAQFARSAVNGEDIVLHTTGESEGNYVYTSDAVCGILTLLLEGKPAEAYNISNEESHISIREMAELVAKEIADNKVKVVIDIPEDSSSLGYAPPVKMWLDASKIQKHGWKPQIGLIESYRRMVDWMQ